MSIIPVTNIINVTISDIPQGLSVPNVNNLALFTTETPGNIDVYREYVSAAQVAEDYGTNSVTAAMANAIFSQSPNILSGEGQLIILPLLSSVSATEGDFVTADISANLANFQAVTNGDIKITIDGVAVNVGGLNFTGAQSLADIATILSQQQSLLNVDISASSTQITFTSKKVGTASTIALATYSGGGTDLNGVTYFSGSAGVATPGVNSSGETVHGAIVRTSGLVQYCGVISNLNLEDAAIVANASAIQALDMIYLQHVCSSGDIAGIATTISTASETHTRILLYTPGQAEANLEKAAYAGRAFSTDFSGSDTSTTMNLKRLATITPDMGINQTLYNQANTAGCDLYVTWGVPGVFSTGGNDYFDNVYGDLALKFALQTAGFNYLAQTNTKVPQTENGISGLKSAYGTILQQFVINDSIAPGAWNSSETFGDPVVFKNNITNRGYYIYSQPIAQQSPVDRNERKAPLVQIAIKRSGAIQSSNVIVLVNN